MHSGLRELFLFTSKTVDMLSELRRTCLFLNSGTHVSTMRTIAYSSSSIIFGFLCVKKSHSQEPQDHSPFSGKTNSKPWDTFLALSVNIKGPCWLSPKNIVNGISWCLENFKNLSFCGQWCPYVPAHSLHL